MVEISTLVIILAAGHNFDRTIIKKKPEKIREFFAVTEKVGGGERVAGKQEQGIRKNVQKEESSERPTARK